MPKFVNTVDVVGDETLTNSIIDRSITEFNDNLISTVGKSAFETCAALESVDLPAATSIASSAFSNCAKLTAFILRGSTVCSLSGLCFGGSPIYKKTGYIYVPSALVDSYKSGTNWSSYASQFRALEDYTVDGTITGVLDPTKI